MRDAPNWTISAALVFDAEAADPVAVEVLEAEPEPEPVPTFRLLA